MNGCIFCKIIKGEILSSKVYEDDNVLAFLDIAPVNKGHTLVIPKKHFEIFTDIPEEELKNLILATKKVAEAVEIASEADGFIVSMNNRKPAGQEIPHAHFHIIPRLNDDGLKYWPKIEYDEGEMQKYKEKISNLVNK